ACGRRCLRLEEAKEKHDLHLGEIAGGGATRWKTIASWKGKTGRGRLSGDGDHVLWFGDDRRIALLHVPTGRLRHLPTGLPGGERPGDAALTADGSVVAALTDRLVRFYDARTLKQLHAVELRLEPGYLHCDFTPDGTALVVVCKARKGLFVVPV